MIQYVIDCWEKRPSEKNAREEELKDCRACAVGGNLNDLSDMSPKLSVNYRQGREKKPAFEGKKAAQNATKGNNKRLKKEGESKGNAIEFQDRTVLSRLGRKLKVRRSGLRKEGKSDL